MVVEAELDEGVMLVEVDLVQSELHFGVIRVLSRERGHKVGPGLCEFPLPSQCPKY